MTWPGLPSTLGSALAACFLLATRAAAAPATPAASTPFSSADVELRHSGLRATAQLGYGGAPAWLALVAQPTLAFDHLGGRAGLLLHTDMVEVEGSWFGALSLRRSLLPVQDSYTRADAERMLPDGRAAYNGVSTRLGLTFATVHGTVTSDTEALAVPALPRDRNVYIESLDVIHDDGWLLRQRLGYLRPLPSLDAWHLGVSGELVVLSGRDASVVRAGPTSVLRMGPSLELRLVFLPAWVSPDTLGLLGGVFELGLRYRFLGGEP